MFERKPQTPRARTCAVLATIVFSAACVHRGHDVKPNVLEWAVVHRAVHYKNVIRLADGHEKTSDVTERWTRCDDEKSGCYDVRTTETESGKVTWRTQTRYRIGAEGYEWTREVDNGHAPVVYRHPKVVLTASPAAGQTWSQVHVGVPGPTRRTCRIDSDSSFCNGGLATTCRTSGRGTDILIRDHFCRSVGWVGSEAGVYKQGTLVYGERTIDLDVGSTVEPPLPSRHFPVPTDVTHPGPVPE